MKPNEVAIKLLADEFTRVGGCLFAQVLARSVANTEQQKSIEANDFLMNIMQGKSPVEKWKMENDENWLKMINIDATIRLLTEDKPSQ